MDTPVLITPSPPGIPLRLLAGAALAPVAIPLAGWGTEGTETALITLVAAISIGVTLAIAVVSVVPRPRLAWLGPLLVGAAALLVAVTPRGVITISIAALAGVGVGLAMPHRAPWRDGWGVAGLIGALAVGAVLLATTNAAGALWWGVVVAVGAAVGNMIENGGPRRASAASRVTIG